MAQRRIYPKQGLDDLITDLDKLADETLNVVEAGVFKGAGVVADVYRKEIEAIPIDERGFVRPGEEMLHGITSQQKAGLLKNMGISPYRHSINTTTKKVGVDGYNNIKTKKFPNGQPNIVVARSICAGTSFRRKFNFAQKAKSGSRDKAVETMTETLKEEIAKRTK